MDGCIVKEWMDVLLHPMGLLGLIGQTCFFCRFLVQWVASERKGASVVPVAFWYLSVGGGLLVLIYALYRRDPVFTLGQGVGLFVYIRNLILIHRRKPIHNDA